MSGGDQLSGGLALALLDQLSGGVVLLGADRRVRVWNRWMEQAARLPAGRARGATLEELFPAVASTRLPGAVEDALGTGAASLLTHSLNPALLPLALPDGGPLLHSVVVRPVDAPGGRACLLQVEDQTATVLRERVLRERGNARYRAIVDTAPEAIVTIDPAGTIQSANDAVSAQFGYGPDELVGRPVGLLLADPAAGQRAWGEASGGPGHGAMLELAGRRRDGTTFDLEVSLGGWASQGRRFLTAILRDVSARKRAEDALRRLNATLEARVEERTAQLRRAADEARRAEEALLQSQKMEAVGQLTGGMAHDFNNLLQAMQACLQLVARKTRDLPEVEPLLDAGRQAVDRGASLVSQLMAFSRKQTLRPKAFDIRDALLGMRGLLDRAIRADIHLEFGFGPGLSPVLADPVQFELAVLNLVVNARDAISADGRIVVSARNRDLDGVGPERLSGRFVEVSVADNGSGMPDDVAQRVFEPFFTTKAVGKGTGLGLSQVYGFCRQSGGTATVTSAAGRGTTVCLVLPASAAAPAQAGPALSALKPGAGARVMFVEDDPVVGPIIATALEELGYSVARFATGEEARAFLVAGGEVDVLFTDMVMPGGVSGISLARAARALRPELPILLTTGYSEEVAGAEEFALLPKPYKVEELSDALDQALRGQGA